MVFANLVEYHVLTKSDHCIYCMLRMVKLHFAGTYTMLHYVGLSGNGKEGLVWLGVWWHTTPFAYHIFFLLNRIIVRWFFVWAEKFNVFFVSLDIWFHLTKKLCVVAKVQICMTIKLLQIVGGAQQLAVALLVREGNALPFQEIVGKI